MKNNNTNKQDHTGLGVALGLSIGAVVGMVFFNGNVGLGLGLGLVWGIALSSIGRGTKEAVLGSLLGAGLGSLAGLVLGLLHGFYNVSVRHISSGNFLGLPYQGGYLLLTVSILAALGLVLGTMYGNRQIKQNRPLA